MINKFFDFTQCKFQNTLTFYRNNRSMFDIYKSYKHKKICTLNIFNFESGYNKNIKILTGVSFLQFPVQTSPSEVEATY